MHVASPFSVIVDDFDEELTSLEVLVQMGQGTAVSGRTRIAAIHATTLMLAAAFEEFVRQMAREHAVQVVRSADSLAALPDSLLETAWRRTLTELARADGSRRPKREVLRVSAREARPKIDSLCAFLEGDIDQNIFDHLIHNENNMRPGEINRMFRVSGLRDICRQLCGHTSLKAFFDQEDDGHTHGDLLTALEKFIHRRNEIAHSLNPRISSAPAEVFRTIDMFRAFAKDLGATLEAACA